MINENNIYDLVIHPGKTLEELLESRNMTTKELSIKSGFLKKYINDVIDGTLPISYEFAVSLGEIFKSDYKTWLKLQFDYDEKIKNICK